MVNYLDLAKAGDLKKRRERIIYRFLEMLPGLLAWGSIIGAFLLSWQKPAIAALFIILFDLYWLLKVSYLSLHQVASFLKMKKNLKVNWLEKVKKIPHWQRIYHLVILPFYKEGKEVIEESLLSLTRVSYPKEKMIIVLSAEEKAGKAAQEILEEMKRKFAPRFFRFLITTHPAHIPGEVPGKGSNEAWAIQEAKRKIIDPLKIDYEDVILSNFDIDTHPYPQYFSCLTFHYLTAKNPLQASYQPIPIYNNNIWSAPAFSRVVATSGSFWQMMQQERPDLLVTFSSHSMAFKTAILVGYPSNLIPDDSRIFWKSYFYYKGNYRVLPLYYPVSLDAVLAKGFLKTVVNQYKQQKRWSWGCTDIAFLVFNFLKDKNIPLSEKIRHSINVIDGFWSWAVASLLIFFLGWLPLWLGGEKFGRTLLSYNLPHFTGMLMGLAMIGMIVSAILSLRVLPPKPKNSGKLKTFSMAFQWLLLPITLIVFGSLPALETQTRLFFGQYLEFWNTEKVRV